jgi:hypothetical protein
MHEMSKSGTQLDIQLHNVLQSQFKLMLFITSEIIDKENTENYFFQFRSYLRYMFENWDENKYH